MSSHDLAKRRLWSLSQFSKKKLGWPNAQPFSAKYILPVYYDTRANIHSRKVSYIYYLASIKYAYRVDHSSSKILREDLQFIPSSIFAEDP